MKVVEKPWGREEILTVLDQYMVKRLHMNPGAKCSLQYHRHKTETVYVLSGVLLLHIHDQIITMIQGDFCTILPGEVHRMEGGFMPGLPPEAAVYLESSTPENDDVVRLKDDYGRK